MNSRGAVLFPRDASHFSCYLLLLLVLIANCATDVNCDNEAQTNANSTEALEAGKKKISEYIIAILEHYKQEDPIGLPNLPITDPMDLPDQSPKVPLSTMHMKKVKLSGLKNFRIHHVQVDLGAMTVDAGLTLEKLIVKGNYTLSSFLQRSSGPFTVTLRGVYVQGNSALGVARDGKLETQDMDMDIQVKNIDLDFENLGMFGGALQGVMNSIGTTVFESIKPLVLNEANTNLKQQVNEQLANVPQQFPNSISPFDQIVAELRKKVKAMGYDPYRLADYNNTMGIVSIQMKNTFLMGLASFHRTGNISFALRNNSIEAQIEVGTQKLRGSSVWEVGLGGGFIGRAGSVSFTVNYLKVGIVVIQPMDTRKNPILEDLQLELGNIQVRCSGAGTADYIAEFLVNFLPNILRYQIMDALENPIKMRVQEKLNTINVEQLIHENIDQLDDPEKLKNFL